MTESSALQKGRTAYAGRQWRAAYEHLQKADAEGGLGPEDLDRLATAAYLIGDDDGSVDARARAHTARLATDDRVSAARSAIWLSMTMLDHPRHRTEAAGWLARAQRLLETAPPSCSEQGWLLCAIARQRAAAGDFDAAYDAFTRAAAIAERCDDRELMAMARHGQGRALIMLNRPDEGFALFDEVIVALAGREVGPIIAGAVYCSVLSACRDRFELRRAHEWTGALERWCAAQPDLVPFHGHCLVQRAELLHLHGALDEALFEARKACDRLARRGVTGDAAAAHYQLAEIHRIRGEFDQAETAYRNASQAGLNPHPGLALLRLAQGQTEAAEAAIRLAAREARDRRTRALVFAAAAHIALAANNIEDAREASRELSRVAGETDLTFLRALALQTEAAVAVAAGRAADALESVSTARTIWQDLDVPYEFARVRELTGRAYRQLGDDEGARLEFDAALDVFERLGARIDVERLAAVVGPPPERSTLLTGREVEVLRLVATGATNRSIAARLRISEKTVARHVSNIFTKLDLSSRSAATAYAYEHKLL